MPMPNGISELAPRPGSLPPDEYPPAIPANKRKPMNCQISEASPISNMVIAIPRLARTSMGLRP